MFTSLRAILSPFREKGREVSISPFCERGIQGDFSLFQRGREAGIGVLETAVALGILGIVVVVLLTGLAAAQKHTSAAERRAIAQSLAEIQIEYVKKTTYVSQATAYEPGPAPATADYERYSGSVNVTPLSSPDAGIQKVIVRIVRDGEELASLEGYKMNR